MPSTLPHDHGKIPKNLRTGLALSSDFDTAADTLKLLSDPRRLQIFWLLCHMEECVINISALLGMSSPAVSHHLKLLRDGGLVLSRRSGKEVYYTISAGLKREVLHDTVERLLQVDCPTDNRHDHDAEYISPINTIARIHALITENLTRRYTVAELAQQFHINTTTLKESFKKCFGKPIATYMKEYRIKRAMSMLSDTGISIAEVAYAVGYENPAKFSHAFFEITGVLPKDYRQDS